MVENGPSYFPPSLPRNIGEWFAPFLRRMEERPLYPAGLHQPLVVRLLCLPTWSGPCSVRVESPGLSFHLSGRELDGEGGYDIGRLVRREVRVLSGEEAGRVWELWEYLRFWSLPAEDPEPDFDVLDGTMYVLEAAKQARYHLVHRAELEWGSTLNEFAELLERFAGFSLR